MDFGRNIRKRAKQIDKNLDKIVSNPYKVEKVEVKSNFKRDRKPLFFSLGGIAACLAIGVLSFSLSRHFNSLNNSGTNTTVNENGNGKTNNNTGKNNQNNNTNNHNNNQTGDNTVDPPIDNNDAGYVKPKKIDISNYVSENFGFSEFAYFAYFADTQSSPSLAPLKAARMSEPNEQPSRGESYFDERDRLHYPIEVRDYYIFENFTYFEFDSHDCDFLEERIGNGHIEALTVETSIFGEKMLVLKHDNKFYSCFANSGGGSYTSFSAHKYIEGWDLVKDPSLFIPLTVRSNTSSPLGTYQIEIDGCQFSIEHESLYYLSNAFEISVNDVRAFIGLTPDSRFGKDFLPTTLKNPIEIKEEDTSISLEEFPEGDLAKEYIDPQDGTDPTMTVIYNNERYPLDGYYYDGRHSSIFAADINYDGYRDIIYLGKSIKGSSVVYALDLYNNKIVSEIVRYRDFDIWFETHDYFLEAYCYIIDSETNKQVICGYADILLKDVIDLAWNSIYRNQYVAFYNLENEEGINLRQEDESNRPFYVLNVNEVYKLTIVIHYENYITIGDKDLFEAVFSSYINNQGTLTELETTYTYDELKNKYTFSFQITEAGEYSLEFMFNNYIVNIAKVIVA